MGPGREGNILSMKTFPVTLTWAVSGSQGSEISLCSEPTVSMVSLPERVERGSNGLGTFSCPRYPL